MISLIKLILLIYIVLTSTKVFALKPDKPDLNIPDSDPNGDGISIFTIIILQLSFYVLVHYLDYLINKKCKETNVDKIDDTHKEEQHSNEINN